ncbi:hypothetical protein SERLA73DRAFT_113347 [Serpula lacrymans var. lacrymans S7.3]|uniref:Insulin-degrading enzyme n=1 Tax=Serpula lacrymans var. lacrymans (strain S7.3) TaxID=936435 RepID=F8Q7Y1_SERL3|nr:hypothetical protein SERLA73DRAFT_113347 [Serpula lacrymans var. lacrymans S7.3]
MKSANNIQADWIQLQRRQAIPPYSIFSKAIEKSQSDDKEYRVIKLENGLHATVIHDPKADTAAASLDVAVGHLYDPDDMPGMAHFCEHLLFMGTEQFPRENEYSEFLSKNNGSSNAFTSTSNTNYYFSVATPALAPALTRFAAFFHCPLFSPSCTSRELNAVDSEHKKNHQADMWRIFQLNKELTKDGHPWKKFGSGNRESLSKAGKELKAKGAVGRETRRRLVEWWSKEYCAGRMRLCVIGKESLDELSDLVSKLFSPISNRGLDPTPMINDHPFGPNEMGTLVSVQTIMRFHAVEISFPLDYQAPLWRYKPTNFLAHFVGHEGPGSLHSYLKNKGWVTSLNSGSQSLARGFGMFKVTIHMTEQGFQNYRSIVLATFKYLSLLRSSTFPAWYQAEISALSNTNFQFSAKRNPDDYAVWLSQQMVWPVPTELTVSAPQLTWEWDQGGNGEKEVNDILNGLTIDQGRVVLMARKEDHERIGQKDATWKTEPWYGTPYRVERWQEDFVIQAKGKNDLPELYLPGPNQFIPTNLNVEKRVVSETIKRPHLIRETPLSTVWYKKDDQFWLPKATVIIELRSPLANASPRAAVLTRIFSDLVNDSLTEFSYDASLAGLSYGFASHSLGLWVTLNGYNDKLGVLAKHVLERVKTLEVRADRLEVVKEQIERDWGNFFLGQTYRLSDYYGRYLLENQQWTLEEKLPEVPRVTVQDIQMHAKEMLSQLNIRMLVAGNMYKDEAIGLATMGEKILDPAPLPLDEVVDRALIPPKASNFVWTLPVPNPNEPNSALTYYVHIGDRNDARLRVIGSLLQQILSEPAFNVLRTKEQLGYVVFCSTWVLPGSADFGLRIVVQSERNPTYLEQRVEAFLVSMRAFIKNMEPKTFEEQKQGLQKKWEEVVKNLVEETNRYWAHIDSGYLDFFRLDTNLNVLKDVNKEDVLSLFQSHVDPASPSRSKISVHLRSRRPRPKKVSVAAADAFEGLAKAAGVVLEHGAWREELGDQLPTTNDFGKYWAGVFTELMTAPNVSQELLGKIPALVGQFPEAEDIEQGLLEGATYIEDSKAFKSSLSTSRDPRPLVEWGDLPAAKF